MHDDDEYLLLLLSDSNLPTGSFVASAGLESYVKHGFPAPPISSVSQSTVDFIRDSLASYARSALPFVSDAHRSVERFASDNARHEEGKLRTLLATLIELDDLYQTMTLNHVARRASAAQGVALLTLYSKGFSCPTSITGFPRVRSPHHDIQMAKLVDDFKLKIRREEVSGHLPICWGILTAALGLRLGTLFFKIA
jgi:urease accessory protein